MAGAESGAAEPEPGQFYVRLSALSPSSVSYKKDK